jgi:hypothetical protein
MNLAVSSEEIPAFLLLAIVSVKFQVPSLFAET